MSLRKRRKNHECRVLLLMSVVQYHFSYNALLHKGKEMFSNISRSSSILGILYHPLTDAYLSAYPRSSQGQRGFSV